MTRAAWRKRMRNDMPLRAHGMAHNGIS